MDPLKDYWLEEIPCLHRTHQPKKISGARIVQKKIGMSVSLDKFAETLDNLAGRVAQLNRKRGVHSKVLITFDDGHKDVLLAVPLLRKYSEIQPALFLTGNQLNGDTRALPLTALYHWCNANNIRLEDLKKKFGFNRQSLKTLKESAQRQALESHGITIDPPDEEMVDSVDIELLIRDDWLIGYHGPEHCDLRIYELKELEKLFRRDIKRFDASSYVNWIAWPEGRYNGELARLARQVGFKTQFGLETLFGDESFIHKRKIWK